VLRKPDILICYEQTPYVDYLSAMAEEVLTSYEAGRIFYDNFLYDTTGCSCASCIRERKKTLLSAAFRPRWGQALRTHRAPTLAS